MRRRSGAPCAKAVQEVVSPIDNEDLRPKASTEESNRGEKGARKYSSICLTFQPIVRLFGERKNQTLFIPKKTF